MISVWEPQTMFSCQSKSLYISRAVSHFFGIEFETVPKTARPNLILATFEGNFFIFLWAKKSIKDIIAYSLKSCIE